MNNMHTIQLSKPHTLQIQTSFSMNQANERESNKNSCEQHLSLQHNFINTQPFHVIQSSASSWQKDLQDVSHNFGNEEIRYLAKFGAQNWNSGCFLVFSWNRCTTMFVLMNGGRIVVQICLMMAKSPAAMKGPQWSSGQQGFTVMKRCLQWLQNDWWMMNQWIAVQVPLRFSEKIQSEECSVLERKMNFLFFEKSG